MPLRLRGPPLCTKGQMAQWNAGHLNTGTTISWPEIKPYQSSRWEYLGQGWNQIGGGARLTIGNSAQANICGTMGLYCAAIWPQPVVPGA